MNRRQAFDNLATHAWFGKVHAKLKGEARAQALDFLRAHERDSHNDFIHHLNRMYIGNTAKPHGWQLVLDLLTAASVTVNNIETSQSGIVLR